MWGHFILVSDASSVNMLKNRLEKYGQDKKSDPQGIGKRIIISFYGSNY